MPDDVAAQPIIVCPLSFERRMLHSTGTLASRAEIVCCGPGASNLRRWATRSSPARGRLIILAGLAGGLGSSQTPGSVWVIRHVLDTDTVDPVPPKTPPWPTGSRSTTPGVSIVSVDTPVCEPRSKRRLRDRTGAELVDLESSAFARVAEAAGWRWGIIRGVSDDVDTRLPSSIGRWISERGRPRLPAIVSALSRRPQLFSTLLRLRRDGTDAMREVAAVLEELLKGEE